MTRTTPLLPAVALVSFLAGTATSVALSQGAGQAAPAPTFVQVDYMKVAPGQADAYLRLERETWMPIHRERIRRGQLRSWALFQVRYPYGTENEYDFVVVNAYDSLMQAGLDLTDVFARVHPNMPLDTLAQRTFAARNLVRGELWHRLERLE